MVNYHTKMKKLVTKTRGYGIHFQSKIKETESIIIKNGGEVSGSFSKRSHLSKDKNSKTSKIIKAEKQGATVIELKDFEQLSINLIIRY